MFSTFKLLESMVVSIYRVSLMRSIGVGRRNVSEKSAKILYSPTYAEISYKKNETRYILTTMDSNNLKVENIIELYPNNIS